MKDDWKKVLLTISRVLFGLAAVVTAILSVVTLGDFEIWPVNLFFVSVCGLCLWFALRGYVPKYRIMVLSGLVLGAVIGAAAFYGGMYWACSRESASNLCGLYGFIYTGPIGFIVGAALGILLGYVSHRRMDKRRPEG